MTKKTDISKRFDCNKNGNLSNEEFERANAILNLELQEEKAATQRKMAWLALLSMCVFTFFLFTPFVPVDRVAAMADLISFFYIAQAGVVGAFMGVQAWISKT